DQLAGALEIAEQPFAVAQGDALLFTQKGPSGLQRLDVALLLEALAQAAVELGALATELEDRRLGLLFEARLAAIQVVEAARHVAGEFHVWQLIGTDRHPAGTVEQDVGRL